MGRAAPAGSGDRGRFRALVLRSPEKAVAWPLTAPGVALPWVASQEWL